MTLDTIQHTYKESLFANDQEVINCVSCGFWHVYPVPDKETLNNYYQKQYYQDANEHGDMKDKNDDPDGYYRIKYTDKLTNFNRLLPADMEKSILDLGAGYGDFLGFMRSNSWIVKGVEPSEYCLQTSRWDDCNILLADLDDIDSIKFDNRASVITLNTVLEHYPYPERLLTSIRENLMDSNTILHIEVPNDFSLLQEVVGNICNQKKYWLCPLGHLNYWNHATLIKFVISLGFKIEIMESTFPLEIMAILGDDYITHPEKGKQIHMKRVEFERKLCSPGNIDLKSKLYKAFAQIGVGREILLYLRKK